ncbi:helix-turn-helix domain-containing protein [Mesorhizobium sp. L-8-10]|uniref:helix-turn-helix domain-containing protein n=1 Tax=Mesorhizobium sp. L-8-10 TaxID=2744523 RepID=UPI001926BC98|nr:XRE family transcriptional regulator [Mesorhizobium sp. L-8-10]
MENIRPIRNEDDYNWALAEITRYFENQPEVGTPDGDRFDVLATLIEAYENERYPIEAPDPVSAIKAHMEAHELTQATLADLLGSRPRASEILNRRRALTTEMIYRLNREWRIPAEILIQPYHLAADEPKEAAHQER